MVAKRVIGLDPGLLVTGWGVIESAGHHLKYIAHGTVRPPKDLPFSKRLDYLYQKLHEVFSSFAPEEAAVEETFVNSNPASTLKLGMARGVVLLVPAQFGLNVGEYSANRVKKTVVGVGHATKEQVLMMVQRILPASRCEEADAADALATAVCHTHYLQTNARWEKIG
jgi:crossover junction endodeoxyribonuclease RuvC